MRCKAIRKLLSSYVDDEVYTIDSEIVEDHLSGCDSCRKALADLKRSIAVLGRLSIDEDPGPEFNSKVISRLPDAVRLRYPLGLWQTRLAYAFAAVFAVICLAIPFYVSNMQSFVSRQDIYMVGQESLIPGAQASVRVVVANRGAETPVSGASVDIALVRGGKRIELMSGRTDDAGTLSGSFRVPDGLRGDYKLVAVASSSLGSESLESPVRLERLAKIMVTADKPIYQPGQTIHLRTLSLLRPSLKPAVGEQIRLSIEDSDGTRVFGKTLESSAWGIASASFELADEVNLGNYTVVAAIGDTETKKTISVRRYVLPKFKISVSTDRTYYLPGQTVRGTVTARYFFGKPAAGASVNVELSALSAGFDRFAHVTGRTNAQGVMSFAASVPEVLAGQPVAQGNALVQIAASVKDTAGHTEETVQQIPVSGSPIRLAVVPESGDVARGLENHVYIVTSYPDGRPARTDVTFAADGGSEQTGSSDELGISVFKVTPGQGATRLRVIASDESGAKVERTFVLAASESSKVDFDFIDPGTGLQDPGKLGSVLMRTDKSVYEVGDTAGISVISTRESGPIYLDAVLDGQTVLTQSGYLKNGRASFDLDISGDHTGALIFSAYVMSPLGVPVRDTAVVMVRPASSLDVSVTPERVTYRPGERAKLNLHVTDKEGRGVPAAVGVNVVDESVFSVEEQMPGLAALYFALQEEILKPKYQAKLTEEDFYGSGMYDRYRDDPGGMVRRVQQHLLAPESRVQGDLPGWNDPNSLLVTDRGESIQRAAKVLFASAVTPVEDNISAVTQEQRDDLVRRVHHGFFGYDGAGLAWIAILFVVVTMGLGAQASLRRGAKATVAVCLFTLGSLTVLAVTALIGSFNPDVADTSLLETVHLLSAWATPILYMVAVIMLAGRSKALAFVIVGISLILLAAILFPVFAKAREAARSSSFLNNMRHLGMALGISDRYPASDGSTPKNAQPVALSDGGRGEPVRVRQFFPETMYSNPAVITDSDGRASVDLTLADSITDWRISAVASSMEGQIGSVNAPLRVFQDFFADIDLPVSVTQGDKLSVPVAVYNYLPRAQSVELTLRHGDWFTGSSGNVKNAQIGPNSVSVVYFPIEINKLGRHALTVEARSELMSDAVRRDITVCPNGQHQTDVANGVLAGRERIAVSYPSFAIPGSSRLLVRFYPSALSQVIGGLDGLLQCPHGCFEQTSSITYPNVLVLDYLRAARKDRPEISMRAEQFISLGYQRLLTFEVSGGGFDWYGQAPANTVLTAYGIMELGDMSKVWDVDKDVINRAKRLLESRQRGDGSWGADSSTYTWGTLEGSQLITAYVTWSLAEGGFAGDQSVAWACDYLNSQVKSVRDPYALALIANALTSAQAKGADEAVDRLADLARVDGDRASWESRQSTLTYSYGEVAGTETTALAAYAFLKSGRHIGLARKALTELIATRDPSGGWSTTQATILALKALLASTETGLRGESELEITVNGKSAGRVRITKDDADTMRQIDLTAFAMPGKNTIQMKAVGNAHPAYQVIADYYVPWSRARRDAKGPLAIDVRYSSLKVSKDAEVGVSARIRSTGGVVKMAIVDLGIPPGFAAITDDLEVLKSKGRIDRYELTPRQIILYLRNIRPGRPVGLHCRLRALYPVRVTVPESRVYDYYNPTSSCAIVRPTNIEAF